MSHWALKLLWRSSSQSFFKEPRDLIPQGTVSNFGSDVIYRHSMTGSAPLLIFRRLTSFMFFKTSIFRCGKDPSGRSKVSGLGILLSLRYMMFGTVDARTTSGSPTKWHLLRARYLRYLPWFWSIGQSVRDQDPLTISLWSFMQVGLKWFKRSVSFSSAADRSKLERSGGSKKPCTVGRSDVIYPQAS